MKKTVNVSLGGYAFTIEDNAYERLDHYLEGVKRRFASYPDASEIIDDIEARMGEKLVAQHGEEKILNFPIIEALIADMGDAEEIDQEKRGDTRHASVPKKLFRDPEDVIIAGVCSGLAAYFGVDPMWPRILFAVTIPFGGFGIVLYFILWMIIPQAKTGLEKAQMKGQPFNLDEFERSVKQRIAQLKAEEGPHLKRAGEGLVGFLREVGRRIGQAIRSLGKVFFKIIGAIISVGSGIALVTVVFAAATLLINHDSQYVDVGLSLPLTPLMAILLGASVAVVAAVPLVFLILVGSSLASGKNKFTRMVGFNLLALWILGLIGAANFAIRYAPEIRQQMEREYANREVREFTESGFSSVSVSSDHDVRIVRGNTFSVTAKGATRDMRRLVVEKQGSTLVIGSEQDWRACIFCWQRRVELMISMPALTAAKASGAARLDIEGFTEAIEMEFSGASRAMLTGNFPSIMADLSGASRLVVSGKADTLQAGLSGASRIDAEKAETTKAALDLSGASRVSLGTVATLSVEASGASRVTYRGNPDIVKEELSGASSVRNAEEEGRFERGLHDDEIFIENTTPPPPIPPVRTGSGRSR